jgi:hypothetical protein
VALFVCLFFFPTPKDLFFLGLSNHNQGLYQYFALGVEHICSQGWLHSLRIEVGVLSTKPEMDRESSISSIVGPHCKKTKNKFSWTNTIMVFETVWQLF